MMMHFEAEIALLQGSFYCCNVTNGLTSAQERVNVNAVCHAVREIIHGLDGDRSDVEKRHWNFKIHAVLFCKLLKKRKGEEEENSAEKRSWMKSDDDCWLMCFDGVSRALPDYVDLNVYLAVAKNLEWGSLCAQILLALEMEETQVLLQDITAGCITHDYLDFLISILTSLLKPSSTGLGTKTDTLSVSGKSYSTANQSCVTSEADTVIYHRLVVLSCEQITTVKSKISIQKKLRFDVIQAMTECLKALVLALYPFEANQEVQSHYDKTRHYQSSPERCLLPYNKDLNFQSHSSEYPSEIYKLHCISSAYLEDYVLTTDEGKTLLQSGLQKLPCKVDRSPESRNHLVAAISTLVTAVHDLLIGNWTDFFLSECIPNTSDECPESETSSDSHQQHTDAAKNAFLVREVLQRLGQCLGKIPSIPEGGDAMSTQLMQLTAYVSDQLDQMEAVDDGMLLAEKPSVTIVTNEQSRNIWLQKAIGRVDARLDGYEDYLGQLLSSSDLWEEESLIECLERNTVVLALPRFVKQLIDVAMEMDEQEIDEALLQRVLKVLLASFTSLPFLLQNHLRDYLWSHPTGASIFTRHNIQNLDHELTSIFNRLVTLAQGHENTEVFRALSCLALQSPSQTLQLTIHRAVSNTAVCQAICQVLRAMPSLATFKLQGNKWSLVCHFIKEAAGNLATSTNEEANLIQLVTTLLQPYKPFLDPRSPFWMPSVLSTQGVTQVCVLPYLKTCTRNSSQMHLMTALKFLKGILDNSQQTLNIDGSIFGSSPFPIMLCLFELLDNCYLLWDDITTATQKVEVKEVVLGLLGRMAGMVKEMHHGDNTGTEHGIAWLFSRVSATLHWTTALHVNELLTDLLPHPMKIVPECLFDICNLSEDSAWFPIPSNNNQRITSVCDQLTELLQCCRVSDNLSAILIQGIQKNKMTSCCQEALTLALVQVLPHCIMGEWQCIMGMLKQLLANGILRVPCSAHYVRELPMVDITDFKVHLSLSQLLLSVMQLLNNPCCEDWATPQLLHHVTRCHVNTMQNLASDILNSDLQNELGSLFVIGQLFCHTCEVISILPTDDLKEQVFVLTLQYLSQLEEVTQTSVANKELDLEWTNQRAMFELVTNQKLAGEQRRTLLQKITSN